MFLWVLMHICVSAYFLKKSQPECIVKYIIYMYVIFCSFVILGV